MFKVAAVLSGLLLTVATDTVWWRTEGGSVIGHRDGANLTCTLTMEDRAGRIMFVWENGLPLRVTVEDTKWRFEPEVIARIAVRIGAEWLANGDGRPNITSLTGRSSFMFVVEQPIEDRLLAAREVTVQTPAGIISVGLTATRISALMAALGRCRHVTT